MPTRSGNHQLQPLAASGVRLRSVGTVASLLSLTSFPSCLLEVQWPKASAWTPSMYRAWTKILCNAHHLSGVIFLSLVTLVFLLPNSIGRRRVDQGMWAVLKPIPQRLQLSIICKIAWYVGVDIDMFWLFLAWMRGWIKPNKMDTLVFQCFRCRRVDRKDAFLPLLLFTSSPIYLRGKLTVSPPNTHSSKFAVLPNCNFQTI